MVHLRSMEQRPAGRRAFGFWICLALVVGNMIGSGVFAMPSELARYGWNSALGWLVTLAGSLCLAFVFARLARGCPAGGRALCLLPRGVRAGGWLRGGVELL